MFTGLLVNQKELFWTYLININHIVFLLIVPYTIVNKTPLSLKFWKKISYMDPVLDEVSTKMNIILLIFVEIYNHFEVHFRV